MLYTLPFDHVELSTWAQMTAQRSWICRGIFGKMARRLLLSSCQIYVQNLKSDKGGKRAPVLRTGQDFPIIFTLYSTGRLLIRECYSSAAGSSVTSFSVRVCFSHMVKYLPRKSKSSLCVPRSTTFPWWTTIIWSELVIVDKRCLHVLSAALFIDVDRCYLRNGDSRTSLRHRL